MLDLMKPYMLSLKKVVGLALRIFFGAEKLVYICSRGCGICVTNKEGEIIYGIWFTCYVYISYY